MSAPPPPPDRVLECLESAIGRDPLKPSTAGSMLPVAAMVEAFQAGYHQAVLMEQGRELDRYALARWEDEGGARPTYFMLKMIADHPPSLRYYIDWRRDTP